MGENESHKAKHGWLDPLNRNIIRAAVKTRNETVVLRDGRRFKLTYDNSRDHETVKMVPVDGFVPRGEFDVKRVTHDVEDWTITEGMW